MKKKLGLMLCTALAVSMLGGCGGNSNTGTTTETKAPTAAASANTITFAMDVEPETLDPTLNNYSMSSIVLQNLFVGLFTMGEDGKVTEGCADTYEMSEDGLKYTFKLKDGLKWSDGSDLTAEDFEYSWKRILNPDTASPASWNLYYIKNAEAYNTGEATADEVGVKAVDAATLEVTLENPTAFFIELLMSTDYAPVKKDVVEGADVWTKSASTYVCNGAFMMKEIKPQESYVLVKNPNYVFADTVKLDGVNIVFIPTPEAALTAFNAGEVDVVENTLIKTQAFTQYGDKDELKLYDTIGTSYYDFNCEHEAISKPEVRKALAMSINREIITQSIVASRPRAAYAYVPYGIPYAGKEEDFRTVNGDLFKEDVEAAKELLAQAGYPNGEGFPTLQFITQNDQEKKDIAQAIQSMWKENLGINIDIVTYESKVYWNELYAGNFDVAFDGWTGDYPDPNTNLNCFIKARTYNQNRWSGENADKYDAMIAECQTLVDNDKRMEIFTEAEQLLMDDMPIMTLSYRNSPLLVNARCQNLKKNVTGHTLFRFAYVAE